jgi:hypothetical protein
MEKPTLNDELLTLRSLLERLETGDLTIRKSGKDVSQQEADILKKEIAALEKTLARLKAAS